MLPFGITSINITDLLAKLFLLSKRTDRMEALLSQKPFWQMFADPSAILVCQHVAMDMLADVVVELNHQNPTKITVFDFAKILRITEHRVEYDLLGAGPVSVPELRRTYKVLCQKYKAQLEKKLNPGDEAVQASEKKAPPMMGLVGAVADKMASAKLSGHAGKMAEQTGSILSNVVAQGANLSKAVMNKTKGSPIETELGENEVEFLPANNSIEATPPEVDLLGGDWVGPDEAATNPDANFQIGDEDDDGLL